LRAARGGVVEFGPGTYLSGSIELKDNITLNLQLGSRLLGSSDVKDYAEIGRASEERSTALIWAIGAHNISLRGSGIIDGNGRVFLNRNTPHRTGAFDPKATRQGEEAFRHFSENREGPVAMLLRPGVLVLFIQCEQVDMREIHVIDAPNWCIHLACCKHATIIGLDVRNSLVIPNADALDLSNCQDVPYL
jgi:polygalacturonase